MGEAFLMKRGGGAGSVAAGACAMIGVRFPAGSTCLCEKGTERLTAENAPGLAAFSLPSAGTWTLTIRSGEQEKSRSVTVAAGEFRVIGMDFTGRLELLSPQNGLADGCSVRGENAGVTDRRIVETGSGFWISPAVDLSAYTMLTVKGVCRYIRQYRTKLCVDQSPDKVLQYLEPHAAEILWPDVQIGTEQTVTLDVSALSGAYCIGSCCCGNTLEITEITLSGGESEG